MASDSLIDGLLSIWDAASVKPRPEDLCRSCPELLDQVRAHIAALQAADRLLNTHLFNPSQTAADDGQHSVARLSSGYSTVGVEGAGCMDGVPPAEQQSFPKIDDYQILRELGGGGQARVYLAVYRQHITRTVKVFHDFGDEESVRRTARILDNLKDERRIVQIQDIGRTREGKLYLGTGYIDGRRLDAFLQEEMKEPSIPPAAALALFHKITEVVSFAHTRGVIHGDLKPANIMVEEGGEPHLLDFDLARTGTSQAVDGNFIGSLPWAAPEQAARQQSKVDTRTDVYSLGVILYFVATGGRFPYAHLDNMADMLMEISRAGVIPPNARMEQARHKLEGRHLRPPAVPVNPDIERVVLKALSRRRDDRFRTAGELGDAIKRSLRIGPARPPMAIGPPPAGVKSATDADAQGPPSIAVLPFANMSRDADDEYFADGLAEDIINAITRVNGLKVIARTSAFAFKGKNEDIRRIADTLGVRNVLEGSVRRSGNRLRITVQLIRASDGAHLWSERYDRELMDVFAIQDEISAAITQQLKVSLTTTGGLRKRIPSVAAYEALLQARHHWHRFSSGGWSRALECFQRALSHDPDYPAAHASLASYYGALAWAGIEDPREMLPKARAAAEKALSIDDTQAEAHAILGVVSGVGDYDWTQAGHHFRRALAIDRATPEVCVPYAIWFLRPQGRLMEALAELDCLRHRDPLSVMARTESAHVLFLMGRYEESASMAQQALDLEPNHNFAVFQLVRMRIAHKRYGEAVAMAEQAAKSDRRWFVSLAHLAAAYAYADRLDDARQILGEMHDLGTEKGYLHATPFATTYAALQEIDMAVEWVERAIEQREPIITTLKTWPVFDPIRSHPRYGAILQRMNLQ